MTHAAKLSWFFPLVLGVMAIAGCGSQRTTVHEGATNQYKSPTVLVVQDMTKTSVQVDVEKRSEFESTLRRLLVKQGFTEGKGLTLKYWVSDADEGSRAARYWLGFGAGTAKLQVSVEFYDAIGTKLAFTDSVGTVTGGYFGGTYSEAIMNSAMSIAEYTKKNYYGKTQTPLIAPVSTIIPSHVAPPVPTSPTPTAPAVSVAQPIPEEKPGDKWQLAINTTPQGAIVKAYDANQMLYQIGKTPMGLLWPLQTEADALVIFWQGREVTLIPTKAEALSIDFAKQPPEVKGATVVNNAR